MKNLKMIPVPGGTYLMGSPADEDGRWADETQHQVWVEGFEIAETVLTVGQVAAMRGQVMPSDPDFPVVDVSWHEACILANEFSVAEGLRPHYVIDDERRRVIAVRIDGTGYRLPSEEEWEYAARAGTAYKYGVGDDLVALDSCAWTRRNSCGRVHPVAELAPNAWGLYDMSGNVWEWTGSSYAVRGELP